MSRTSLNKSQYGSRRVRKISATESEYSYDEQAAQRLTGDAGPEDPSPEDDVASICEYHDIPPPPDGGYGWVIVFASFMCNMIVDGIAYTFGIFMKEFEVYFGVSSSKVAWVGSLLSGVYLMAGPVVSALTNKFGCRPVCIAGSFIGAVAFVLSIFSTSVNMLMMTYGVLGGIGFGLVYLPAVVCVGYYFETKRSLATGIAVCGSGFGTFAFAPLARFLLDSYQWKGANLILAGLILNCAVFGALMRPLTYPKCSNVKPLLQRMAEEKRFQMERGSIGGSYFLVQLPDGSMEKRMKMPINIDPGVHSSFNLDQLVPGTPLTPVPTVPTLPTISEVKVQEHSSSSHTTSNSESVESKGSLVKKAMEKDDDERQSVITESKESSSKESPSKETKDTTKEQQQMIPTISKASSEVQQGGSIPRNASQPSFTTHVQGLPKNGSVPFFDRIRKTSAGERYKPSFQAIKNATRAAMGQSVSTSSNSAPPNGEVQQRKSFHLRLSTSSMLGGSKNNNSSAVELDDGESITFSTSKTSVAASQMPAHREKSLIVRPLSRKDIFYSGSIYCLPEYQSQKSLANYRQSVLSLPKSSRGIDRGASSKPEVEQGLVQPLCPCFELPDSFKDALGTMLDMSLLKNPIFFFICISNIFGMAGLYIPFFYLVEAAKKRGIDVNSASFLLSVIGVTNTVGRVACGYVADFPNVDSLLLNNVCLIISTISMIFTVFCSTYTHFILMSFFFGMAISGYISLTSIILVDLLGLEKLTNAFGLLILFRGVAAIGGPPIAGKVYDITQNYDLTFYMAAFFFFLSTVASFVAPMMNRCMKEQAQPIVMDILTPIDEEDIEDEEEEDEMLPEIVETTPSPQESAPPAAVGTSKPDTKESE